jgi:hypothetical protein
MAAAVNVPTCTFGDGCKHPANQLLVDCKPTCKSKIHRLCGEECPFHVRMCVLLDIDSHHDCA